MGRVLISGASIAGPTLAYWLNKYGFEVTLVERAKSVRAGGYPIDLRGPAVEVAERTGILPGVQVAHIDTQRLTWVDEQCKPIATIRPEQITGGR
ncbi:MAG: FAD-dependent oxidoreductase, partial [Steroidobacteraceae bacterium]